MSVAERMVALFFRTEGPFYVGLSLDGKEVTDPGYKRQLVKVGGWRVAGAEASTLVRFGPFNNDLHVDSAELYDAEGRHVEPLPLGATVALLGGMGFEYEAIIDTRAM